MVDSYITIEDTTGNKFLIHGKIGGFTLKEVKGTAIKGLDSNWHGKNILCIVVEKEGEK